MSSSPQRSVLSPTASLTKTYGNNYLNSMAKNRILPTPTALILTLLMSLRTSSRPFEVILMMTLMTTRTTTSKRSFRPPHQLLHLLLNRFQREMQALFRLVMQPLQPLLPKSHLLHVHLATRLALVGLVDEVLTISRPCQVPRVMDLTPLLQLQHVCPHHPTNLLNDMSRTSVNAT